MICESRPPDSAGHIAVYDVLLFLLFSFPVCDIIIENMDMFPFRISNRRVARPSLGGVPPEPLNLLDLVLGKPEHDSFNVEQSTSPIYFLIDLWFRASALGLDTKSLNFAELK